MAISTHRRRRLLLAVGVLAFVAAAYRVGGGPDDAGRTAIAQGARAVPVAAGVPVTAVAPGRAEPDSTEQPVAGGVVNGVVCPDGSTLPLLNGVPSAPPIRRPAHLGPLPPVVGRVVDDAGDEWYQHADGSTTTTRWRTVTCRGVLCRTVETLHNARLPTGAGHARRRTTERGLAGGR